MMSKKQKITIIHGWSYSLEKWQGFIKLLAKAGYDCELLTIPGLTEGIDRVWTLEDYVGWLDTKLSFGEKHILLGHSNGGRIAIAYAHRFPDKVTSLVLIDSAGVIHRDIKTLSKKFVFKTIAKLGKLFTQSDTLRKILYKIVREQDYYQASPIMKQTMVNLISFDVLPLLPVIQLPVLLIWGEKDKSTPLKDGKKIKNALTNSVLFTLPFAKHSPQFTHPEQTAHIIISNLPKL